MAKLPSFQFYPGDWMKDANLRRCSKAARGVWIDMICLSFECEERGVFQASGVPWSDADIAAAVGGDTAENLRAIAELLAKGVCSRNQAGAIFCRRVVRDEHKRRICSEAGKKGGGNPALTFKGEAKGDPKGGVKGDSKRNPKASSSLSSSEEEISHTQGAPAKPDLGPRESFLQGPSEAFKRFAGAYPRKIAPAEAWNVWQATVAGLVGQRAKTDREIEDWLVDRAEVYATSPAGLPPPPGQVEDYRPSPARWLKDGKYDEPYNEWQKPNVKGGANGNTTRGRSPAGGSQTRERQQYQESLDALAQFAASGDRSGVRNGAGLPVRLEANGGL